MARTNARLICTWHDGRWNPFMRVEHFRTARQVVESARKALPESERGNVEYFHPRVFETCNYIVEHML